MMKTYDAWAIQTPRGWIKPERIRERRTDCIADFVDDITPLTWRELRSDGWKCVRVRITAVDENGKPLATPNP